MAKPTNRRNTPSRSSTPKAKPTQEPTPPVDEANAGVAPDTPDTRETPEMTVESADAAQKTPEIAVSPEKSDPTPPEPPATDSVASDRPKTADEKEPPVFEPTPKPAAEPSLTIPPTPVEEARIGKGPGFLTLLLGGLVAGFIGYAIAEYDLLGQGDDAALAEIESRMSDQSARIETLAGQTATAVERAEAAEQAASASDGASAEDLTALRDEVAALRDAQTALRDEIANAPAPAIPEQPAALPDLEPRLSALETRVEELSANLATLAEETADAGASAEAMSAYEAQLAALQQELDSQRAAIADAKSSADAARSSAADETRRITVQAALAQISAALENGEPFVDATSALDTAGGVDVPAGLSDAAPDGVATLSALQSEYPSVARRALGAAIRDGSGGGALDRLSDFLKAQTGARSLDAREGDDPDAILSRAEAALRTGDLATVLSEIDTLPEAGQAEMADWTARVRDRHDATTALADLTASLNSN